MPGEEFLALSDPGTGRISHRRIKDIAHIEEGIESINADKEKLDSLHNYELPIASAETLGGIKIGEGLEIAADGTVSTVITPGATINWNQVVDTPTTLEGYGIEDAATKEELAELEAKIVGVFHYKGSVNTEADLDNIENPEVGDVYNILENGKNFAWDGEAWDDLGGFIDLSGYWSKEELVAITVDEINVITGYAADEATFREIIKNGGDAALEADMAITESFNINKDLTLDLNGKTITGSVGAPLFNVDGAKLVLKGTGTVSNNRHIAVINNGGEVTIEDGSYNTSYEGFKAIGEGSKIVMNGGTLNSTECGLGVNHGAMLEFNGGTVLTSDNMGIGTNGSDGEGGNTIIMNGGEIVGSITSNDYEAIGVYIANNDTFIMNGGSIIGNGGAGIVMRAGNVTINNGYIEGKSSENRPAGTTGWVGDDKTKMDQSGIIYHESANYPGKEGMSLTVNGGIIKGVVKSLEVLSNEVEPSVVVTGGEFTPAYQPID
jgi:hypothetical protein